MNNYITKIILIGVVIIVAVIYMAYSTDFFGNTVSEMSKNSIDQRGSKIKFLNPSGFPITFTYDPSSNSYIGYIKFETDTKVNQTPFTIENVNRFRTEIVKVENSSNGTYIYIVKVIILKDEAKRIENSGMFISTNNGAYAYFEANLIDNSSSGGGSDNGGGGNSDSGSGNSSSGSSSVLGANITRIVFGSIGASDFPLPADSYQSPVRGVPASQILLGYAMGDAYGNDNLSYDNISLNEAIETLLNSLSTGYSDYGTKISYGVINGKYVVVDTNILSLQTGEQIEIVNINTPANNYDKWIISSVILNNRLPENSINKSELLKFFNLSLVESGGKILLIRDGEVEKEFGASQVSDAISTLIAEIKPGYKVLLLGVETDGEVNLPNSNNLYYVILSKISELKLTDGSGSDLVIVRAGGSQSSMVIDIGNLENSKILIYDTYNVSIYGSSIQNSSIASDKDTAVYKVSISGSIEESSIAVSNVDNFTSGSIVNSFIKVVSNNINTYDVVGSIGDIKVIRSGEFSNIQNSKMVFYTEDSSIIKTKNISSSKITVTGDDGTNSGILVMGNVVGSLIFFSAFNGEKRFSVIIRGSVESSDVVNSANTVRIFVGGNVTKSVISDLDGRTYIFFGENAQTVFNSNVSITGNIYINTNSGKLAFNNSNVLSNSITSRNLGSITFYNSKVIVHSFTSHGELLSNYSNVYSNDVTARNIVLSDSNVIADSINSYSMVAVASKVQAGEIYANSILEFEDCPISIIENATSTRLLIDNSTLISSNIVFSESLNITKSAVFGAVVRFSQDARVGKVNVTGSKLINITSDNPFNVTNSYVINSKIKHGQIWEVLNPPNSIEFTDKSYAPDMMYFRLGDNVINPLEPAGKPISPGKYVFIIDSPVNYTLPQPMFHSIPQNSDIVVVFKSDVNISTVFDSLNKDDVYVIFYGGARVNSLVKGDVKDSKVLVYTFGYGGQNKYPRIDNIIKSNSNVDNVTIQLYFDKIAIYVHSAVNTTGDVNDLLIRVFGPTNGDKAYLGGGFINARSVKNSEVIADGIRLIVESYETNTGSLVNADSIDRFNAILLDAGYSTRLFNCKSINNSKIMINEGENINEIFTEKVKKVNKSEIYVLSQGYLDNVFPDSANVSDSKIIIFAPNGVNFNSNIDFNLSNSYIRISLPNSVLSKRIFGTNKKLRVVNSTIVFTLNNLGYADINALPEGVVENSNIMFIINGTGYTRIENPVNTTMINSNFYLALLNKFFFSLYDGNIGSLNMINSNYTIDADGKGSDSYFEIHGYIHLNADKKSHYTLKVVNSTDDYFGYILPVVGNASDVRVIVKDMNYIDFITTLKIDNKPGEHLNAVIYTDEFEPNYQWFDGIKNANITIYSNVRKIYTTNVVSANIFAGDIVNSSVTVFVTKMPDNKWLNVSTPMFNLDSVENSKIFLLLPNVSLHAGDTKSPLFKANSVSSSVIAIKTDKLDENGTGAVSVSTISDSTIYLDSNSSLTSEPSYVTLSECQLPDCPFKKGITVNESVHKPNIVIYNIPQFPDIGKPIMPDYTVKNHVWFINVNTTVGESEINFPIPLDTSNNNLTYMGVDLSTIISGGVLHFDVTSDYISGKVSHILSLSANLFGRTEILFETDGYTTYNSIRKQNSVSVKFKPVIPPFLVVPGDVTIAVEKTSSAVGRLPVFKPITIGGTTQPADYSIIPLFAI